MHVGMLLATFVIKHFVFDELENYQIISLIKVSKSQKGLPLHPSTQIFFRHSVNRYFPIIKDD